MREPNPSQDIARGTAVQTTGHAWDGDLQEFNNPLPRWWVWSFYGTVVFAIIYWLVFPTWPYANTWTSGMAEVTYTNAAGEARTLPWNTRSKLLEDIHEGSAAVRQREFLQQVAAADFDTIRNDPDMLAFARSAGNVLFGDNCAACHGSGGQGVVGLYPNLADDDWLWGGDMATLQATLAGGRNGFMPAFGSVLDADQRADVAEYVLSLSAEVPADSEAVARGEAIFHGHEGGCFQCHGGDARGIESLGSANLTDAIWTIADVPGQTDADGKRAVVSAMISAGVGTRQRVMPAWSQRLSEAEIKLLAVYVHQLGGGE